MEHEENTSDRICGKCFWHRKQGDKWVCLNYCGRYKEETRYNETCKNADIRRRGK